MTRRPWTPSDTATLERMQGRPDREIAEATGHKPWKVREMRQARGLKAYSGDRSHWSRRDWLLAGAASDIWDIDRASNGAVYIFP